MRIHFHIHLTDLSANKKTHRAQVLFCNITASEMKFVLFRRVSTRSSQMSETYSIIEIKYEVELAPFQAVKSFILILTKVL